ncbi:MAG: hypothetical protein E6L00_02280 [Thaumarchaeota archaeon]|nr:MAG: hypothetical protein E6L00_02280 [Nitrososphaerota archaeon]
MDYEKFCKKVLELDSKIRFAGMINEKGRLFAGGMREGLKPLEDTKDDEMLFMELVLRTKMRHEFDHVLGSVKFAMSYRERAIVMSFTVDENVLLKSTEQGFDFTNVPFKILKILSR